MSSNPGGNGPALTAGTLGVTAGVTLLVGCLVAAAPELDADAEFLSEPADGLESGADKGPVASEGPVAGEGTVAGVRTGVSEPD